MIILVELWGNGKRVPFIVDVNDLFRDLIILNIMVYPWHSDLMNKSQSISP